MPTPRKKYGSCLFLLHSFLAKETKWIVGTSLLLQQINNNFLKNIITCMENVLYMKMFNAKHIGIAMTYVTNTHQIVAIWMDVNVAHMVRSVCYYPFKLKMNICVRQF